MRGWLLVAPALVAGCGQGDPAPSPLPGNSVAAPANAIAPIANRDEPSPITATPPERKPPPMPPKPPSSPTPAAMEYRAIGTEPFWAVTIRAATATLERPDSPPARFAVTRADDARTIRYTGEGFTMTLTPGPCSDGMSDAVWSDRVQIAFGDGVLKGCGGIREDTPDEAR